MEMENVNVIKKKKHESQLLFFFSLSFKILSIQTSPNVFLFLFSWFEEEQEFSSLNEVVITSFVIIIG